MFIINPNNYFIIIIIIYYIRSKQTLIAQTRTAHIPIATAESFDQAIDYQRFIIFFFITSMQIMIMVIILSFISQFD